MAQATINQWLRKFGYEWVEGREELLKGELSEADAQEHIERLRQEGAIRRG